MNIYPRLTYVTCHRRNSSDPKAGTVPRIVGQKLSVLFVVFFSLFLNAGYSLAADKKTKICFISYSSDSQRAQVTVDLARENAQREKVDLVVFSEAFRSLEEQFKTFQKVRQKDCGAIIIEPHGPSPIAAQFAEAINKTIENGIPVITILGDIEGAKFTNQVVLDTENIGSHLAFSTCSRLNKGEKLFHVFPHYGRKRDQDLESSTLKTYSQQLNLQCAPKNIEAIEVETPHEAATSVMSRIEGEATPALIVTDHPFAATEILKALKKRFGKVPDVIKMVSLGTSPDTIRSLQDGSIEALLVGDHVSFSEQALLAAVLATKGILLPKPIKIHFAEMTLQTFDKYKAFWATF